MWERENEDDLSGTSEKDTKGHRIIIILELKTAQIDIDEMATP